MKYTLRRADTDTEEVFVTREMRVEYIYVDELDVGVRKRPLDSEKVAALAESMKLLGLLNPITVYLNHDENRVELVTGRHRLEAAKQLGWEQIPGVYVKTDAVHRELLEIDENLIRHNLTPAQEAEHLVRRKELWETINSTGPDLETEIRHKRPPPEKVGQAGPVSGGRGNKGFAAGTAKKTGKSKRSINRALQRGKAIDPGVMAEIRGTHLDTGRTLDALAKVPPEEQKRLVAEAKAWKGRKHHRALKLVRDTDDEAGVAREDANALTMDPDYVQAAQDLPAAMREPVDSSAGCTTKKSQRLVEDFGVRVVSLASFCRAALEAGIPDDIPKEDAKSLYHELVGAHVALGKLMRKLESRT